MSEYRGRLQTDDRGGRLPASAEGSGEAGRSALGARRPQAAQWIRVTTLDNIPPREGRAVSVAGREIAIFNLGPSTELGAGDRFVAVDNQCPHKAGPLADGIVTGTSVVCPLHTWKISLLDGSVERPSTSGDRGVTAYPTRVEEGVIVVAVPAAPLPGVAGGPPVAAEADNKGWMIQECQSEERLLRKRSLDPPCPHAEGCVSSNRGGPGV